LSSASSKCSGPDARSLDDDDLAHIVDYIRKDNPAAARRAAQTIYTGIAQLRKSPNRGRISRAENTRELVFSHWPYT